MLDQASKGPPRPVNTWVIEDRERLNVEAGIRICAENGYTDYKHYPSGRDACIQKLFFTYAVYADLTTYGHGERWCYSSYEKARDALSAWDGEHDTEPQGWHRHPDTGRRRPDGDASQEFIAY